MRMSAATVIGETRALERVAELQLEGTSATGEDKQLLNCKKHFDRLRSLRKAAVDEDDDMAAVVVTV